jgi:hypothetical protein
MSRVRLEKISASLIPIPPTGKASLFLDGLDGNLKLKLDDGNTIILNSSEEYIQDLVANFFADSASLEVSYDDLGDSISINIKPNVINDYYVDKISPVKITDTQNGRYQSSLTTTNSTPTLIQSISCAVDGSWMVEARVTCRRIGGLSGSAGDSAVFKRSFRIKSEGSTVTVHDIQADYTSRDLPNMQTTEVSISVSSTNVNISVVGISDTDLKWNADTITNINT